MVYVETANVIVKVDIVHRDQKGLRKQLHDIYFERKRQITKKKKKYEANP